MFKWVRDALLRINPVGLGIAVAAIALSIRVLACFSTQSDWDVYGFALIARDILHGKLPYAGIFDHKPVGLNYIFAAFMYVLGETVAAMQLVALCAAVFTALIIYKTVRLLEPDGRRFAVAFAAMYLALSVKNDGVSSMSE